MVKLIFTDQYANLFLMLNGLAILFYLGAIQQKRKRAMKFGNYETLQKVAGRSFLKSANVILFFRLVGISLLLIGISNPVIVEEVPSAKSDYVLAIDSSSSMLAEDFEPNRFQAAKKLSTRFLTDLPEETNVGATSFSGNINIGSQLDSSRQQTIENINNIQIGDKAGTAIGEAVISSSSLLLNSSKNRSVVLITDGRNNVGSSINESIDYAVNNNVTVNTIGIGSSRNNTDNDVGLFEEVNATEEEFPNIDTGELQRISNKTGGKFIAVRSNSEFDIALSSVSDSTVRNDISGLIILLALGVLLTEWVLGSTRYSVIP